MKTMINSYKAMIKDISEEVAAGMLQEKDTIQILRADSPAFKSYCAIVDWYYDDFTMQEEITTPIEEMYIEDEFSKEEWTQMKKDQESYKEQYLREKDKLQQIAVKDALTEMKQMVKLFK